MTTPGGTLITCQGTERTRPLRFLLMDAPSPSSLSSYIREMQKHNVQHLVRVCGPTYKSDIVERAGIQVHHWQFEDGAPPPHNIVDQWLALLDGLALVKPIANQSASSAAAALTQNCETNSPSSATDTTHIQPNNGGLDSTGLSSIVKGGIVTSPPVTVAVHCVAGLGRAPILVAVALVEYGGLDPLDAIGYIRERRRGAINNVQLNWLMKYKRRSGMRGNVACCVVC